MSLFNNYNVFQLMFDDSKQACAWIGNLGNSDAVLYLIPYFHRPTYLNIDFSETHWEHIQIFTHVFKTDALFNITILG